MDDRICIRCTKEPAVGGGYCGRCYWDALVEIQTGFNDLTAYLERWAQFADWCVRNGRAEPDPVIRPAPLPRRRELGLAWTH